MEPAKTYAAFLGHDLVHHGALASTLLAAKARVDAGESAPLLFFDDRTGQQLDFDLRGSDADVVERLATHPAVAPPAPAAAAPKAGPGRPKLGVVSREVSLLPRHWEWLGKQPGGASATLRRLVEQERRRVTPRDALRAARDAASRVMWALAGQLPGFEDATRALFAGDDARLAALMAPWPEGVRAYVSALLAAGAD